MDFVCTILIQDREDIPWLSQQEPFTYYVYNVLKRVSPKKNRTYGYRRVPVIDLYVPVNIKKNHVHG